MLSLQGGNKYQHKKGKIFSLLQNKIIHALYSSVSESFNTNTETVVMGKDKTEHLVQIVYEILVSGADGDKPVVYESLTRTIKVRGGRDEIATVIEQQTIMLNEMEKKYELEDKYEIKRLYIDKIKQDLDDF